jgi:hypothetical protein
MFLGSNAGTLTVTGSNLIVLGCSAQASSTSASNEIVIGNASHTSAKIFGNLTVTGTVTAQSDERFKERIENITNALQKTLLMRGVFFNRKDFQKDQRQIGLIAQEVQKIISEAVLENPDGTLSVAYGNLVALLIEAIKEQNLVIEDIKKRIELLEEK